MEIGVKICTFHVGLCLFSNIHDLFEVHDDINWVSNINSPSPTEINDCLSTLSLYHTLTSRSSPAGVQ